MNYDYNTQDATFPEDLERSKIAVNRSAQFFSNKGYPVIVEPTFLRPDFEHMHEFSDNGDLKIVISCEVKHRPKLGFTCAEDFPFKTIIVDSCQKFDKKKPIPFYYTIWNNDYRCIALVDVYKTKKSWNRIQKYDFKKNRKELFYELDKSLVKFIQLETK